MVTMLTAGPVARRELELRALGRVPRRAAGRGEDRRRRPRTPPPDAGGGSRRARIAGMFLLANVGWLLFRETEAAALVARSEPVAAPIDGAGAADRRVPVLPGVPLLDSALDPEPVGRTSAGADLVSAMIRDESRTDVPDGGRPGRARRRPVRRASSSSAAPPRSTSSTSGSEQRGSGCVRGLAPPTPSSGELAALGFGDPGPHDGGQHERDRRQREGGAEAAASRRGGPRPTARRRWPGGRCCT